jgi:Flp pilus assembly protein protease CpaA
LIIATPVVVVSFLFFLGLSDVKPVIIPIIMRLLLASVPVLLLSHVQLFRLVAVYIGGTSHRLKSLLEHKLNEVFTFTNVSLDQL